MGDNKVKIIIAGCGKIGASLIRLLSAEGYELTIIDTDSAVLDGLIESYDVMSVCGNCATQNVLIQAGVKEADLLIAASGTDEINMLSCMVAHGTNPKIHTIARIRNPEYSEQSARMRDLFGLSMVVNPERQAAAEIERLLKYPGFLKRDTFAKGRVEIVELKIDGNNPLRNTTLMNLEKIVRCKVLVCVVLRDGQAIAPSGEFVLCEGDRIFVTGAVNEITVLLKHLGIVAHKAKKVLICGAGRLCHYLTRLLLHDGSSVTVIEKDREKCVSMSEIFPNIDIICGDASSQELLESEHISDYDATVTMTGMDELNILISLYGSRKGVRQNVTKITHFKDSDIINALPLGSIISPDELCCNRIVRYVRAMKNQTGAAVSVHLIADRKAEAMEFRVDEHTLHCGEPLRNIRMKSNVLLACITNAGAISIPNGDSVFRKGDTIVVVTTGENIIYQLNDIFE